MIHCVAAQSTVQAVTGQGDKRFCDERKHGKESENYSQRPCRGGTKAIVVYLCGFGIGHGYVMGAFKDEKESVSF